MPTQTVLRLVDTLASEVRLPGAAPQAAFIRALVDEVHRYHPGDGTVAPVREQLGDEVSRLADLIAGAAGAAPQGASADRPLDVLVVDDEDHALRAAEAVLRTLGFPCRTARDAEEALRAFDRAPASILLSDWSMPGMSGLALCRALKRMKPETYVILATAHHDDRDLREAVREGVDDFLPKPLQIEDLEVRLLAASRLLRALGALESIRDRIQAPGAIQETAGSGHGSGTLGSAPRAGDG